MTTLSVNDFTEISGEIETMPTDNQVFTSQVFTSVQVVQ